MTDPRLSGPDEPWRVEPPARAPERLSRLISTALGAPAGWWRIHKSGEPPLDSTKHPTGKFRFDAPAGGFPVTYVNSDEYAVFAEPFGDARDIPPSAGDRRLVEVFANRPLHVLPIDDATVQKAFGLDLRICADRDYRWTRAWSRAWHRWYPEADGVRFVGRHTSPHLNLCLYLDRCLDALSTRDLGDLKSLRAHGLEAAARYSLAPRLYFEP